LGSADFLSISDRDAEIVRAIEEEGLSLFTFDGLRRITGAHPETLSRTLERLEEDGFIVHSPEGYSTTDKARDVVSIRPAYDGGKRVPILKTYLPYGASLSGLVSALKGRWFDKMRWVGMSETEDGVVLKWVTDDGSALIDAQLSMGMLDVEAKLKNETDLPKAVRAAHQLVGRISRLYSGTRPGGRAMMMEIGYFKPYAM
jgi:DNA-binding Lrp family transcriptional regulator